MDESRCDAERQVTKAAECQPGLPPSASAELDSVWVESACSGEATEEELKTQDALRQVQALLDKPTPHNFNDLVKQLSALRIGREPRLRSLMELVFDKAAPVQDDCAAYAHMCHHPMTLSVASDNVNLHKLLLGRCQSQFDNNQNEEPAQNEEAPLQARRPSPGNVKPTGELCDLQVPEEGVTHDRVVSLLKAQDEESFDCLSKLLPRFGKDLDTEEAKMDGYFDRINHNVQERKTSPRTCFLQDVLDLRKNNRVPPQPEEDPVTTSQIHVGKDLEGNDRTGVTEESGEMMDGDPNWSRHPQETTEASGSKEVSMETVAVTESVKGNSGETFDQESNGGSAWTQISGEAADGPEEMQVSGVTTSTSELENPQSEPSAEHEATPADGDQSESTSDHTQKTCGQSTDQAKPSILKSKNKGGCTKSAHRVDFDHSKYGVRFYFVDGDSECLSAGPRGVWSYVSDLASKFQAWYKSFIHNTEQFDQNKPPPRRPTRRGRSNPHDCRSSRRFRSVPTRRAGRVDTDWENWPQMLSSRNKTRSHDRPDMEDWRAPGGQKCCDQPVRDDWCLGRESEEAMAEVKRLQQEGRFDQEMTNPNDDWTSLTEMARVLSSALCQTEEGGAHLVNTERLIKRSEVLKKVLDDDQKQLEALNILQGVVEQLQHPKNVLQLFFDFLFDQGVVRKEVFHKWASAAALQGNGAALDSVGGFFRRLREPERSSSALTLSWPKASEERSIWGKHSRTPAEAFKQRSHSL